MPHSIFFGAGADTRKTCYGVADARESIVTVGPVAGIGIVHVLDAPITLAAAPHESEWSGGVATAETIRIHHRIVDPSIGDASAVFEVGPHATYYQRSGDSNVLVLMTGILPDVNCMLLATVRGGREYEMRYGSAPADPVPRSISEIPAYALALAERQAGVLAHGCGFVMPSGRVGLCLGVSGAGKSTLARMMQTVPGVRVLNDDRIVLGDRGDGLQAWSTPWPGRAGIARLGSAPLGAIAVIGRGPTFSVRRLSSRATTAELLRTVTVPIWNPGGATAALETIAALQERFPIVKLEYPLAEKTGAWILETMEQLG